MALIKLVGFLVGLRFGASLWGFAWASPSGFAFGLRLRASPSGPPEPTTRLKNPWAMLGVVPEFPAKHPRQTAVVLTAKHGRAAYQHTPDTSSTTTRRRRQITATTTTTITTTATSGNIYRRSFE